MKYAAQVKKELKTLIREMASAPMHYVKNPATDFRRTRKLDFETMLRLILCMESGTLKSELLEYFKFSADTPTSSAFIQQRSKLSSDVFEVMFHKFNLRFPYKEKYKGYQLLACDGTDLNIARNPSDKDTYFQSQSTDKGFNQLHMNVLYDLCSKRYVDAIVQPARKENEALAMTLMVDRFQGTDKTIFIADRGYEAYNVFAHIQEKGMYYLIRVKDGGSGSMAGSFILPSEDEFDHAMHLILTRKRTSEVKSDPKRFKVLRKATRLDYLDDGNMHFYPLDFRVVRFAITTDSYECVITNLPSSEFPPSEIKKLYSLRWNVETSFRELKYALGLTSFHSKKPEFIVQEIYAKLVVYNYCMLISLHIDMQHNQTKFVYQLNYTMALFICRRFIRNDISPPDVEKLLRQFLLPLRPERSDPRKVKSKSVVSFLYRPL